MEREQDLRLWESEPGLLCVKIKKTLCRIEWEIKRQ